MTKTEALAKIRENHLNENFKQNLPLFINSIFENRNNILKSFLTSINETFTKAADMQKDNLKEDIALINISIIRSDAIFNKFNYRIDAFNEKWYGDKVECCVYWNADFLFKLLQEAMEQVFPRFKDYPHILYPYDLQTLKMMEIVKYHIFAVEAISAMIKQATELESFNKMQKINEFKIVVGEYMDASKIVYPFPKEDEKGIDTFVFEHIFSDFTHNASHTPRTSMKEPDFAPPSQLSNNSFTLKHRNGSVAVNYFVLSQDSRVVAPRIKYEYMKKYSKAIHFTYQIAKVMPEMNVFQVLSDELTDFTDVLSEQLFLVSADMGKLFQLFDPELKLKTAVMFNRKIGHHTYKMPLFREVDCLSEETEFYPDNRTIKTLVLKYEKIKKRKIFKVRDRDIVIIRMDVAESILRRCFTGIHLEPVAVTETADV